MKTEDEARIRTLRFPKSLLMAPGPHALTPAVARALAAYRAEYTHRSEDYFACYARAVGLLRECFGVPEDFTPLIFGHSGSYCWEMVARNTPPGTRAVGMDIGSFSSKWASLFSDLGREIDVLKAEWGTGPDLDQWKATVRGSELALAIHNETSTGVALPIDEMAAWLRSESPDTLLAIDGVSIAGAVNLNIADLRPDYYLWSLQKDFSIPAIGSVMIVSNRAVETARAVDGRGYVLDLVEWVDRAAARQTPMTVPDLMLKCLIARLEEMLAEGPARFRRHAAASDLHRNWATSRGLGILAQPGWESPTVTAIALPVGVAGPELVQAAKRHLNVVLAPGYGKTRDGMFRIAAMGQTTVEMTERVLEGLGLLLDNWSSVQARAETEAPEGG